MDKNEARALLEPLLQIPTAPYHEDAVSDHIRKVLGDLGLPYSVDSYGNVIVRRPARMGAGGNARIGFMAHMDHPGFEVIESAPEGVVAAWHGGVQAEYFTNAHVRFHNGSNMWRGTIRRVTLAEDRSRIATALVEVRGNRPPLLTPGTWDLPPVDFVNGVVRAPALDDTAGCGLILSMLAGLGKNDIDAEVWAIFTRAEEVGFIGAIGLARSGRLPASLPVVSVEMSKALPGATQGLGPVVRLGDRSSVFDHAFLMYIRDVATALKDEQEGFKFQRMLMEGGSCEATALNAFGFRTAGLAIPLGNYHNQAPAGPNGPWTIDVEEISFSDYLNAVDLMVALCERFPGLSRVLDHHRTNLLQRTEDRLRRLERNQRDRERTRR